MNNKRSALHPIRARLCRLISGADIVVWQLPQPVSGCSHAFKYRLAFVVKGVCVLRYDNEVDKGDHKHFGDDEMRYEFSSPRRLVADFMNDVRRWQDEHSHT